MDKPQMQKERERLQGALDRYNALEPVSGHHAGLEERIAHLDRRIALAPEG
jgi:hypothetical protein